MGGLFLCIEYTEPSPVLLDDGMIVEDSSPEEIFSNPKQARTREFLSRIL